MHSTELFTMGSMLTLAGAVTATTIICNGVQLAFDFNPKWMGLAISMAISFFGVYYSTKCTGPDFFVGLINGFLIFSSSVGINRMAIDKNNNKQAPKSFGQAVQNSRAKRKFFSPWF